MFRLLAVGVQHAEAGLAQAPAIGLQAAENSPGIGCCGAAKAHDIGAAGGVLGRASPLLSQ
jgi:hypothetical protein